LASLILLPFSPRKSSVSTQNIFPCQSRLPVEKTVDRAPRFLEEISFCALASRRNFLIERINPYLSIENQACVAAVTDKPAGEPQGGISSDFHNRV
jgi:hypothetical protein